MRGWEKIYKRQEKVPFMVNIDGCHQIYIFKVNVFYVQLHLSENVKIVRHLWSTFFLLCCQMK